MEFIRQSSTLLRRSLLRSVISNRSHVKRVGSAIQSDKCLKFNSQIVKFRHFTNCPTVFNQTLPHLKMSKLDCPEFHSLFTPELKALVELFDENGHQLRIAGGAVRDLLLGKMPHDVDFATTATPEEMKALFGKHQIRMINNKGESHGTITCRINDKENFEVTTLRIDVATDGRHAEVEFTKDWQLDALRRDLTINSMFLGFDGTLYDYFNGQDDLGNKKVRFVGNATDRIREDYLRILRYFRFYGRIAEDANGHEAETLDAIRQNAQGLGGISGERIWVELKKIMTGNHAANLFQLMMELGLTKYLGLPVNMKLDELFRVHDRSKDMDPHHMMLIAAALRDENEVTKFNERMKMSKDEFRTGVFIILHRDDNPPEENLLRYCQDLMCDTIGKEPRTKDKVMELLKYWGKKDALETFTAWDLPKFPVSGHSLLDKGVQKGPTLAKMIKALRTKWKESNYTATEQDLLVFVDELKDKL